MVHPNLLDDNSTVVENNSRQRYRIMMTKTLWNSTKKPFAKSLLVLGCGVSVYYARRPGGTAGRCIIVLRDVVDSYLFRMHTFHVTSHCIIGPTGSSMNKHTKTLISM